MANGVHMAFKHDHLRSFLLCLPVLVIVLAPLRGCATYL